MSIPDNDSSNGRVKTLGIRFEADIHADMTLIASLRGTSFQAEVLEACRAHVASVKASPELASKADDALAEIEREAAARREAFSRLFGTAPDTASTPDKSDAASSADQDDQIGLVDRVFPVTTEGLAAAVEHEHARAKSIAAPASTTSRKSQARSSSTGSSGGEISRS